MLPGSRLRTAEAAAEAEEAAAAVANYDMMHSSFEPRIAVTEDQKHGVQEGRTSATNGGSGHKGTKADVQENNSRGYDKRYSEGSAMNGRLFTCILRSSKLSKISNSGLIDTLSLKMSICFHGMTVDRW
jgi:hypothetical protein